MISDQSRTAQYKMQAHSGHNRFIHYNTKHRIEALVFFFFFDIDHSTLHPAIVKKKMYEQTFDRLRHRRDDITSSKSSQPMPNYCRQWCVTTRTSCEGMIHQTQLTPPPTVPVPIPLTRWRHAMPPAAPADSIHVTLKASKLLFHLDHTTIKRRPARYRNNIGCKSTFSVTKANACLFCQEEVQEVVRSSSYDLIESTKLSQSQNVSRAVTRLHHGRHGRRPDSSPPSSSSRHSRLTTNKPCEHDPNPTTNKCPPKTRLMTQTRRTINNQTNKYPQSQTQASLQRSHA